MTAVAKTIVSSTTVYLSAAECLKRVDARPLQQLCSDTGTQIVDAATLATHPNFLAILLDANGDVEKTCLRGGRYTAADLQALATTTCVGQGTLFRLIARLVILYAFERRGDLAMKIPETAKQALEDLADLGSGEALFGFQETVNAGLVSTTVETAQDVEKRMGASYISERLFGRRGNRRDPSGGGGGGGW